jgi:YesN/AraC family two-component response regulator
MNNSITLVLADDHPLLLSGLMDQLEKSSYNVIASAENGAQALTNIIELKPTITILDEEMPMLTGFEVIKKGKEKGVETKFIMLSTRAVEKHRANIIAKLGLAKRRVYSSFG